MPLASAAIAIWVETEDALLAEHDAWHSSEHLPERMGVPGFVRGRRAAALDPAAARKRFVLYEIESIAVTTSAPYLERLNNPTPWSKKVMRACRLSRTLCRVAASAGEGFGAFLATLAPRTPPDVTALVRRRGIVAAHWLERDDSISRPQTSEERIRRQGVDASVDAVLVVEAYDREALSGLDAHFGPAGLYQLSHLMHSRNSIR